MKYKAILFDFDDTLVESRLIKWEHHKFVAKTFYDIDLSDEEIREHWGKPFNDLMALLYRNSDTLEKMHEAVLSTKHDFPKKAYAEAQDVMKKLIDEGMLVGVISAAHKIHLLDDLERLDFPYKDFFVLQGSDEVSYHKPDPMVFEETFKILEGKDIQKESVLYVGDSLDDLKAAHGAGINFIALTTGLYTHDDFENAGAKIIVDDIREIVNFIF